MLSLTTVWVQHPIQIRNKDHTTTFCWANSSSDGKYPVGELEGEVALLGCRYVKSKQEIIRNTLPFSYKITKSNALKSIIFWHLRAPTGQSVCDSTLREAGVQWGAEGKGCLCTSVLLEPLHGPHCHGQTQEPLGSLLSSCRHTDFRCGHLLDTD